MLKLSVIAARIHTAAVAARAGVVSKLTRGRSETLTVALTSISRFEFCLLSRRDKVRVFFQILNDFFSDNFTFKTTQGVFD